MLSYFYLTFPDFKLLTFISPLIGFESSFLPHQYGQVLVKILSRHDTDRICLALGQVQERKQTVLSWHQLTREQDHTKTNPNLVRAKGLNKTNQKRNKNQKAKSKVGTSQQAKAKYQQHDKRQKEIEQKRNNLFLENQSSPRYKHLGSRITLRVISSRNFSGTTPELSKKIYETILSWP